MFVERDITVSVWHRSRLSATSLIESLTLNGFSACERSGPAKPDELALAALCHGLLIAEAGQLGSDRRRFPIAILATDDAPRAAEAIRRGATGVVTHNQGVADIVEALEVVVAGGLYLAPTLADATLAALVSGQRPPKLTVRQYELLGHLATGTSTASLATMLGVSQHSARNSIRDLLRRLNVHSRAEAVALAHRLYLTVESEPAR